MNQQDAAVILAFADLADRDDNVWELVMGAIADSRDQSARRPDDRDSGEVTNDLIRALRETALRANH